MKIDHKKLRELFSSFWEEKNHQLLPPAPLVPKEDPTTLFNGSGMQQLVPYLLGEIHPLGTKLYNIQPCFRAQDIDEIGDNRHTTFFEMMGNWSLGDYFKMDQLSWFWKFLTEVLKLPKERLYVSVFAGDQENNLPPDEESKEIWKKIGIKESHIFSYGPEKNWWSRTGAPNNMPENEPGGPDSEVFFEFTQIKHNPKYGDKCHPNCDCGRFLEIGNSVFMEYRKNRQGFSLLPKKNVDFGGGFERIIAVLNNQPDIFQTELYLPIIQAIEKAFHLSYQDQKNRSLMRIIADHLKAAVFIIKDGVLPSNKERGYVLRRLLRRAILKMYQLKNDNIVPNDFKSIVEKIINIYQNIYFNKSHLLTIYPVIENEISRFNKTLKNGLKIIDKLKQPTGKDIFNLYQSFGFPKELSQEILREKGIKFDENQFNQEFEKHRQLSRTASAGLFKGGLADHSQTTIKYHTATHLIHQALFDVLGNQIRQEGSHINKERLRFDFFTPIKPTKQMIKKVEEIVNQKIKMALPVTFKILPKEEALKIGAKAFFREKYPDLVKVYFIGDYSKEFCGGPHVKNTKEIEQINIYKLENIGSQLYRIYAK